MFVDVVDVEDQFFISSDSGVQPVESAAFGEQLSADVQVSLAVAVAQRMWEPLTEMYLLPVIIVGTTLLPNSFCLFGFGRKQSVAVRGLLQCNGVPASNVKVKLYDKEILFDKKLDQGKTDSSGYFYLSGSKTEITNIDPKVNIYHKCGYKGPCYKKFSITIPDSFITRGSTPKSTFDIGRINLAGKFKGQSIDCIN
ncbi:hypothetical protein RB195_003914 [Necator americanus]|uniref:Transthyretin-like family protein n=1 Tax=Necator americanus TaxID=51031 RepID=A0ABR1DQT3_NECAM